MNKPYRVIIVDDSALMRKLLTELLGQSPDLEVVGTAMDPFDARDKIKLLNPDVITLDVEMPRMDGLTFLRNLMRLRPMPVVMISSLTEQGAQVTMDALESGALDFITKPRLDLKDGMQEQARLIIDKVVAAAGVSREKLEHMQQRMRQARDNGVALQGAAKVEAPAYRTTDQLIAIGSSTGGLDAIRDVLVGVPVNSPGIVIAQHIPATFSRSFAERMDKMLPLKVEEAFDNAPITTGRVYIAPGDRHLVVVRSGAKYVCRLSDEAPVNRHKPSVEVLFDSVAQAAGKNALAIMLTGMGKDGAEAMLRLRQTGAPTIAQDEATSVVWGMPGVAVKLGAVEKVLPIQDISAAIRQWIKG
jgi:two-component system chemotaxis response regulator CheB